MTGSEGKKSTHTQHSILFQHQRSQPSRIPSLYPCPSFSRTGPQEAFTRTMERREWGPSLPVLDTRQVRRVSRDLVPRTRSSSLHWGEVYPPVALAFSRHWVDSGDSVYPDLEFSGLRTRSRKVPETSRRSSPNTLRGLSHPLSPVSPDLTTDKRSGLDSTPRHPWINFWTLYSTPRFRNSRRALTRHHGPPKGEERQQKCRR